MRGTSRITWLTAVLALAVGATGMHAQVLPLGDALRRADEAAWANRIGASQAAERAALATGVLRGVLPSLRAEAGFVRTTDPIGAFGTTLRQRSITQADFDPSRLNFPAPANNWVGSLVLEQPVFNADAYLGRSSARRAAESAEAAAEWTRTGTRLDVIRAYYGAVLAAEKVGTLEAAHAAALSHVKQATVLVDAGLATRSDALLAEVKAGEVEVQLAEARDESVLATRQLAVLLAEPADVPVRVPESLPSVQAIQSLLEAVADADDSAPRADVMAASLGESAARADARRATSLLVPRVNAFARYDWNSPNRLYGGDENWTVGLMASWVVFGGGSTVAERRATAARLDAARAASQAAVATASLELEKAESARRLALARLEIAQRGVRQSEEAHRIVSRKYEGGLATVTEVLEASALETQSRLSLAAARRIGLVSAAERLRASGRDPGEIVDLLKPDMVGLER